MNSMPLTVVVTSYNRESFLGASIESVLNNTYESFELLVVDDSSTDDSLEIARSYEKLDRRVRVVANDTNLGDYPNRNRGIGLVESTYLKYHDSDDLMYPHCLETLVSILDAAPEAGFALSTGRHWPGGPCPMLLTPRLAYEREYLGSGLFSAGPSGALFRTEVIRALGGFPERGVASDYLFWVHACARTNVVLAPADLTWYREHAGQEIRSAAARRDYAVADGDGWKALLARECPLDGVGLDKAKRNYLRLLLKKSWRDVKTGHGSTVALRLSAAGVGWRNWIRFLPLSFRNSTAGTPVDADGGYLVPDWVRPDTGARRAESTPRRRVELARVVDAETHECYSEFTDSSKKR